MKRILLALAIIASITACTKPETPNIEPESYVGYLRSEHPSIKIPGISVNGKIVYDLKASSWNYGTNWHGCTYKWTYIYSDKDDKISTKPLIWIAELTSIEDDHTELYFFIPKNTAVKNEIQCNLYNGENDRKTDNVASFRFKNITLAPAADSDTVNCGIDAEITLTNGDVIEIVYYGNSILKTDL